MHLSYKHFKWFAFFWTLTFIIYFPAAHAGRVGDFPGWVKNLTDLPFWDYVNRTQSHIPSLYQFTQIVTWTLYHLVGTKAWLWHLIFVTLQGANATLAFVVFRHILIDSRINDAAPIALGGCVLFCVTPYVSEVVVWEPAFHYLQGLLFILLILAATIRYLHTQAGIYAWAAGILFLCSTYSLEVFYLTPFFVITLCAYYCFVLKYGKTIFRSILLYFSLPQLILFALHFVVLHAIYHTGIGHIGSDGIHVNADVLSKPLKYLFHILFLGRFFPEKTRQTVYQYTESFRVLIIFYAVAAAAFTLLLLRLKRSSPKGRLALLLLIWVIMCVALISPIWFGYQLLVIYDRYTYVLDVFLFMLVALLISYITIKWLRLAIFISYAAINLLFTVKVVRMWKVSGAIVNTLVPTFPNDPGKIVLITNVPECYNGVQMIGSRDEGEFAIMYNALMPNKLTNPVFEISAFNILSPNDGAHVTVINDSMAHVTLNQWGTWWWWFGFGAIDFENEYYKLKVKDVGHWYELTLKKPSSQYTILYIVGDKWKKVDWDKKNIDQY